MSTWRIIEGDCREALATLPERSAHTCVTSPPYFGLRDYGHGGQIGLEPTPDEFVAALVAVFRGVRRVLRDDGTVWLNLGDSYAREPAKGGTGTPNGRNVPEMGYTGAKPIPAGMKQKDLIGIPWLVAFALRADGWYLRSDIIWSKPNPMPESVTDRPTKAHEYVFLLSKGPRYFYDGDAIREDAGRQDMAMPGGKIQSAGDDVNDRRTAITEPWQRTPYRNKRSVWTVATQPYAGAHFATFPPKLIEPCILAGAPERACGECGAPWVRVMERGDLVPVRGNRLEGDITDEHKLDGSAGSIYGAKDRMVRTDEGWSLLTRERIDKGFQSSCNHDAAPSPGVVLDPFAGSGTTGMVALRHGRSFLGVELSPAYAAMARERIVADAPLLNSGAEMAL